MLRTVIYARVSTEDQLEKYGLPAQLRACREYAKAKGFEVVEEICDEGISGAILERPGLERLRHMVRDEDVDVVLSLDPDRLSRELVHLLILKPEIEKHARLEFVGVTFENTPTGRLFFQMKGAIAEYERAVLRDRMMRGKRERAKSGLRVGGREPYGYRDEEGRYAIDEARGVTARQIFDWYDAGVSLREIALRLRAAGAPTWGGGQWGYTSVRAILTNEVYTGVAYWGQDRITLVAPPLVGREQWDRIQARLAENPHTGRPSSSYLLRGLLYCGCGLRMYGEASHGWSGRYYFYRCRGRNKMLPSGTTCNSSVSAPKLDTAAWEAIEECFTDADRLRAMLVEHEAGLKSADPARIDMLEAQARKLRLREQAALDAMLDRDLADDRAALKARLMATKRERIQVEQQIAAEHRFRPSLPTSWADETAGLLREYITAIGATAEGKQQFIRGIMTRADWTGEELEMACFIGPESGNSLQESEHFYGRKLNTSCTRNEQFGRVEVVLKARVA